MIDRKIRVEMVEMVEKDNQLSQRKQCELLSIHRNYLYYQPKEETAMNLYLMQIIDRQYTVTPFYGVPRMTNFINKYSIYHVNKKRVERLYKLMDIRAIGPNPYTSKAEKGSYKYPYLLRGLKIEKSNQVWAADITYIAMRHGFMYLFAIIDLHSRYILNWGLSNTMTAPWCVSIIKEAIFLNEKPAIFNTDQGSQFTSEVYISLLQEEKIKISMDGKGRAIDNIFIERFWRSIKQEYVYINPPNGGMMLYDGIEEYMRFYNYERDHQTLEYFTPAEVYYGKKVNFKSTKYLTTLV
jgi:putative transposase